jgi:hypothetical protein
MNFAELRFFPADKTMKAAAGTEENFPSYKKEVRYQIDF